MNKNKPANDRQRRLCHRLPSSGSNITINDVENFSSSEALTRIAQQRDYEEVGGGQAVKKKLETPVDTDDLKKIGVCGEIVALLHYPDYLSCKAQVAP